MIIFFERSKKIRQNLCNTKILILISQDSRLNLNKSLLVKSYICLFDIQFIDTDEINIKKKKLHPQFFNYLAIYHTQRL